MNNLPLVRGTHPREAVRFAVFVGATLLVALLLVFGVSAPADATPASTGAAGSDGQGGSGSDGPGDTTVITAPPNASPQEQQEVIRLARERAEADSQANPADNAPAAVSAEDAEALAAAEEARRHAQEVQRRLEEIRRLSETISAKQAEVLRASAELDVMDEELALVVEEYNRRMIELEEARFKSDRLQENLELAQGQLLVLQKSLENRIVGTYKNTSSALEILLDTTDLKDFVRRMTLLVDIAQSDTDRVDEIETLRTRIDRLLDEVSRRIYDVTLASEDLERQRAVIEGKMAERQALVDTLSSEIKALVDEQRDVAQSIAPSDLDLSTYLSGDGNAVVKTALRYLGVPYVWGGESPAGFDCSGLVLYVFRQHGVFLPHYSRYQATMGYGVPPSQAAPGDLVFFGSPVHHVGIYMGDDLFVHAPRTGDVVKISRLSSRDDLTHVRRFTFVSGETSAAPDDTTSAGPSPAAGSAF